MAARGNAHAGDERHLSDYLRVLYKRRRIAIPVFLLVGVMMGVNSFRQTKIYQAHVQLMIEKDTPNVARLDQIFQTQDAWISDEFYQTQYRVLQSRTLAKRTLDAMQLWGAPRLGNGPEPKAAISVTGLAMQAVAAGVRLVKSVAGNAEPPPPSPAVPENETVAESNRVDEFLGGLSIEPVRNSRLVDIGYISSDPQFAAAAANAVAKAYIDFTMESKFAASKEATDWLGDRLAEQRKAVEASEAALQAFKEANGTVSVADGATNIVVQRMTDLSSALTKAKTDRINKEALYNQLKSAEGSGALETFPAVLTNDYIQKLKSDLTDVQQKQAALAERYNERHPEMIKSRTAIENAETKLRIEISKVVASVKNDYLAALSEEQSLQGALNSQKGEALSLNRKGIEFNVLQREAESNRQIYESLMQRTKETGITSENRSTNVRVMDQAEVPRVPILPRRGRDLTMAFVASLLLAVGTAFAFEYMDNRIKLPDELRSHLGISFLGMVPALGPKAASGLITGDVPAAFAEAIKSIRTNVLFSSTEEGLKTLVVTSAGPGEGKSSVATNLALALSQTGLRVLIVDGDMRRPRVHEIFQMPEEPGLSNLLVGNCKPSEAIRPAPTTRNLWILPAGQTPPNPAELVGSKRFGQYLTTLAEQFDWVVIDSPPVLVVSDAAVLANVATGVVFVVGAEQTTRHAAHEAIEQLHAAKAHIIGGVLNRVAVESHPYYYSRYYRKNYARYYTKSSGTTTAFPVDASSAGERRSARNG